MRRKNVNCVPDDGGHLACVTIDCWAGVSATVGRRGSASVVIALDIDRVFSDKRHSAARQARAGFQTNSTFRCGNCVATVSRVHGRTGTGIGNVDNASGAGVVPGGDLVQGRGQCRNIDSSYSNISVFTVVPDNLIGANVVMDLLVIVAARDGVIIVVRNRHVVVHVNQHAVISLIVITDATKWIAIGISAAWRSFNKLVIVFTASEVPTKR